MGQKKIVLDTNILISAFGWPGKPRKIFRKVLDQKYILVESKETLTELRKVLDYPKFGFDSERKIRFLALVTAVAELVGVKPEFDVIKADPSDNKFLDLAVAAKADYIVSGDRHHLLQLKEFREIKIVTPAEFLELEGLN